MPQCYCGKDADAGHLKVHQKTCPEHLAHRQMLVEKRAAQSATAASSSKRRRISSQVHQGVSAPDPGPDHMPLVPDYPTFEAMDVDPIDACDAQQPAPLVASPPASDTAPTDPVSAAEPAPEELGPRRRTQHRVPRKFRDLEPEPLAPVEAAPSATGLRRVLLHVYEPFRTKVNSFGLFRIFKRRPEHDPDQTPPEPSPPTSGEPVSYYPYPNRSAALFNNWFWNDGSVKTRDSRKTLLDLILDPSFALDDLRNVNWRQVDAEVAGDLGGFGDGWLSHTVNITIPGGIGNQPVSVPVEGFQRRPLIPLWKNEIQNNPDARNWTWTPSRLVHRAPDGREVRVHGEAYHSPRAQQLHDEVQQLPRDPEDAVERCVLLLMQGSDGTHLAQFGSASGWPGYTSCGNQSKNTRIQQSAHAMHHFASFPKLPDSINDEINNMNVPKSTKTQLLAHLRRELMQGCWNYILDDDFRHAYAHGFLVLCQDGVTRRFYPRFFAYIADYPEKMLLATLRDNGDCPCPRCTVKKSEIHNFGTDADDAIRKDNDRRHNASWISNIGRVSNWIRKGLAGIKSVAVENILKPLSHVATRNAFSALKAIHPSFSIFKLFTVDLLHEVELGVWKALLIHLLRLLHAHDPRLVEELDRRFRQIPVFARFSIRRFKNNVSELKQLAAHNFEDILQCAIPAFEELLPEPHNTIIMTLLYILAEWHALAKLRMHTDDTLRSLRNETRNLGMQLRLFVTETCAAFKTTELPREQAARNRRETREALQGTRKVAPTGPKEKKFNMDTYKMHALADYAPTIEECGTTESYSTLLTENTHPELKERYRRSNKRNATTQMGEMERIQANTRRIVERAERNVRLLDTIPPPPKLPTSKSSYIVSLREKEFHVIGDWVKKRNGQRSADDFTKRLRNHILGRLLNTEYNGDETEYSDEERTKVIIINRRMYEHHDLHLQYTTYDVRQGEDFIRTGTDRCDIILRSHEDDSPDDHPYWYARVLGIYHVNTYHSTRGSPTTPQKLVFLHVRWFGRDLAESHGRGPLRLTRLGWDREAEYGFVDPRHILRACHIVPAFAHGARPPRIGFPQAPKDWNWYYVMRWSDRDLFMRYRGGGIGHTSTAIRPADGRDSSAQESETAPELVAPAHADAGAGTENASEDGEHEGPELRAGDDDDGTEAPDIDGQGEHFWDETHSEEGEASDEETRTDLSEEDDWTMEDDPYDLNFST
ncbi:hypothetical protein AURDEDRAFT_181453 [Auricularia subglabra TFB-10046 SS5]|nr:hypothetical protein AURDEDRAFT_181453 [Auricularia subglabra TFB-10046 SS5]